LLERRKSILPFWIVRSPVHEHADAPRALALLRARRDRPSSGCAAKRDNEFSPSNVDCHVTPSRGGSCPCYGGDDTTLPSRGLRLLVLEGQPAMVDFAQQQF
jgi:hypothetical protein